MTNFLQLSVGLFHLEERFFGALPFFFIFYLKNLFQKKSICLARPIRVFVNKIIYFILFWAILNVFFKTKTILILAPPYFVNFFFRLCVYISKF